MVKQKGISAPTVPVVAREEDGTIQITVTIPKEEVSKAEAQTLGEIAQTIKIPGFRPGKAPLEDVKQHASAQTVLEKILAKIIPPAYQKVIKEHNLKPILTPRFELVKTETNSDWQIRALTCEIPNVELGDYQKELEGAGAANKLWTPDKAKRGTPKEPTQEEKENLVLDTLLKTTKVTLSKLLIEEEVNHRLAGLVDQTQKLGLSVDEYLARTNRTVESLKQEYTQQAESQLKLMILLSRVAQKEGITVSDDDVNEVLQKGENSDQKSSPSESQKEMIKGVLLRRRALDRLTAFV